MDLMQRRIESPKAIYEYDGKGLLIVTLTDDLELDLEDIKEQRAVALSLHKGQPHVVLAIAGARTSATEAARKYASSNIPQGRVAEAVIIKSLSVRLLGNFYLKFHKPGVPTKMFTDREEAIKWLKWKLEEATKAGHSLQQSA